MANTLLFKPPSSKASPMVLSRLKLLKQSGFRNRKTHDAAHSKKPAAKIQIFCLNLSMLHMVFLFTSLALFVLWSSAL